jgi:hypothetical protein
MTAKTSGDSSPGVLGNIFTGIQDSFTTQGLPTCETPDSELGRITRPGTRMFTGA